MEMPEFKPPRPGEVEIELPATFDAGVYFIGRIRTPWTSTSDCPKSSRLRSDVVARIEIFPPFTAGLKDLGLFSHAVALYWLDRSRRDLIEQLPSHLTTPRGVFALRSPVRPNPIGIAAVEVVDVDGTGLSVRNIDCIDGTPLIDLKPYFASLDSVPDATRP
ncbi:MAG: tRNA (N6-threonylcarbamoyladenosine(37)-N6)-methyltransferase TrmO [Hyphomicrobiaceae bacterium]|nr:tRNA (N6-threonylcarbamoyladenosine(37)-N6)-methyltransferase TrmO [Hyphomicrobiaceae bacterium]